MPTINPNKFVRPNKTDKACFALQRVGKSNIEIAAILGTTPEEADRGHLVVEMWRNIVHNDIVRARVNEEALRGLQGAGARLHQAQGATRKVRDEFTDSKGVIVPAEYVPDHDTAIKAIRATAELYERFQEKKGQEINVNQQMAMIDAPVGRSYESRLRMIREKHGIIDADPSAQPILEAVDEEIEEYDDELENEEEGDS
jgi:hypothetical protein